MPHNNGLPTDEERSIEAARLLLKAVNIMGFNEKVFAHEVCNDHRTLQQGVMRAFVACIKEWATHEHCDLRNQRTVEVSKRIVAILGDELYFPHV